MSRIQICDLPSVPTRCPYTGCVYNQTGEKLQCYPSPRECKGNSDARCHKWSNKQLLKVLGILNPPVQP